MVKIQFGVMTISMDLILLVFSLLQITGQPSEQTEEDILEQIFRTYGPRYLRRSL